MADDGKSSFERPDSVLGTPNQDSRIWDGQQSYSDTCAIRCQEFILQQFTGVDIPEDQLVCEARDRGWYEPGAGSPPECVGNLLELHGIAVNRYEHASVFHLANELAQGHKVIIGIKADRLWEPDGGGQSIRDQVTFERADHAVVVSGIDTSDPMNPQVIVSDPGTGQAVAYYPMQQFLEAWRASDFTMVATAEPAPAHLPEMVNFPYDHGHIPAVANMPYDEFILHNDHPETWVDWFDQQRGEPHDWALETIGQDLLESTRRFLMMLLDLLNGMDEDHAVAPVPHDADAPENPAPTPERLEPPAPYHPEAPVSPDEQFVHDFVHDAFQVTTAVERLIDLIDRAIEGDVGARYDAARIMSRLDSLGLDGVLDEGHDAILQQQSALSAQWGECFSSNRPVSPEPFVDEESAHSADGIGGAGISASGVEGGDAFQRFEPGFEHHGPSGDYPSTDHDEPGSSGGDHHDF